MVFPEITAPFVSPLQPRNAQCSSGTAVNVCVVPISNHPPSSDPFPLLDAFTHTCVVHCHVKEESSVSVTSTFVALPDGGTLPVPVQPVHRICVSAPVETGEFVTAQPITSPESYILLPLTYGVPAAPEKVEAMESVCC
jgi:hypothetical protein